MPQGMTLIPNKDSDVKVLDYDNVYIKSLREIVNGVVND